MPSILITGANRGLGLEFARQYAADGWRVFACCRSPDKADQLQALAAPSGGRLSVHRLDVSDHAQIEALSGQLRGEALDILLNNAGVYGPNQMTLGHIDYRAWAEVFAVNVMAPTKMVESFLEQVARSRRKTIACVSSLMGSIAANRGGRHYLYRSTKAALNAVVKSLAVDLQPRGVAVVTVHPGWVKTDMGGPDADLEPAESIRGLRRVLDRLTPADSGKFLSYDGAELPW
jgi:NAD(P)-dependent dehydrogenase (short-subunit alcohol dehydrogenase family)